MAKKIKACKVVRSLPIIMVFLQSFFFLLRIFGYLFMMASKKSGINLLIFLRLTVYKQGRNHARYNKTHIEDGPAIHTY